MELPFSRTDPLANVTVQISRKQLFDGSLKPMLRAIPKDRIRDIQRTQVSSWRRFTYPWLRGNERQGLLEQAGGNGALDLIFKELVLVKGRRRGGSSADNSVEFDVAHGAA